MTAGASQLPTYDGMMNAVLRAIRDLGGSGTIEEINERVYEIAGLSDETLAIPHGDEGGVSEIDYRLAWSRTYLKKYGALENSTRGIWAIRPDFDAQQVDPQTVVRYVRAKDKEASGSAPAPDGAVPTPTPVPPADPALPAPDPEQWQSAVRRIVGSIPPAAFERLIQRLLREAGFTQVQVTGRSGDGGIDGKGLVRVNDFLTFHVLFQCKRYSGSVGPSEIRDFRGAMQGRADKGLFITTGTFTSSAKAEAVRDGAPPIDLIDGELLVQKLEQYQLGLRTEIISVKNVIVDSAWFSGL